MVRSSHAQHLIQLLNLWSLRLFHVLAEIGEKGTRASPEATEKLFFSASAQMPADWTAKPVSVRALRAWPSWFCTPALPSRRAAISCCSLEDLVCSGMKPMQNPMMSATRAATTDVFGRSSQLPFHEPKVRKSIEEEDEWMKAGPANLSADPCRSGALLSSGVEVT